METKNKKSDHFVIVIDKQREMVLQCLFEAGFRNPIGNAIFQVYAQMNKVDLKEVEELFIELMEKRHAMGWCDDPNCTYNKDAKRNRNGEA